MKPEVIARLKHSPLIEVMLRVDFKLPSVMTEEKAMEFGRKDLASFDFLQSLKNIQVIDIAPTSQPLKLPPRWAGSRFKNDNVVITIGAHAIGISILNGYECWEDLLRRANPLVEAFRVFTGATGIQKVSVRSVNRIIIEEGVRIGDYLANMPSTVEGVDTIDINEFSYRDVIHDKESDAWVVTNKVLQRVKSFEKAVVLDIEVFKLARKSVLLDSGEALTCLRGLKDAAFKGSLNKEYFDRCSYAD